ncbi:hypothetical protein ACEP2Y_31045, partial [Pseudomonas aeruginosa]
ATRACRRMSGGLSVAALRPTSRTADPVPVFVPIDANLCESERLKALILLLYSPLDIAKKIAW